MSGPRASVPRFEKRSALLEAALASMADVGPAKVQPSEICERLGLSKALVNYHFGGREGLIAEAMAVGYERYVDALWAASQAAGSDPVERLVAWFTAQVRWIVANTGLAVALSFPHLAAGLPSPVDPDVQERLTGAWTRNFTNLTVLVAGARSSLGGDDGLDDPESATSDAALIAWTSLGMSMWFAGEHLPTRTLREGLSIDDAVAMLRPMVMGMLGRGASSPQG